MPVLTASLLFIVTVATLWWPDVLLAREPSLTELLNGHHVQPTTRQNRYSRVNLQVEQDYSVASLFKPPPQGFSRRRLPGKEDYSVGSLFASDTEESVASPAIPPQPPMMELETIYHVGCGDILDVQVWEEPDFSRQVTVRYDGFITLPLLGDIQANGRAIDDLQALISSKLGQFVTDPMVTITLQNCQSRHYYMVGKVAQPGE